MFLRFPRRATQTNFISALPQVLQAVEVDEDRFCQTCLVRPPSFLASRCDWRSPSQEDRTALNTVVVCVVHSRVARDQLTGEKPSVLTVRPVFFILVLVFVKTSLSSSCGRFFAVVVPFCWFNLRKETWAGLTFGAKPCSFPENQLMRRDRDVAIEVQSMCVLPCCFDRGTKELSAGLRKTRKGAILI